MTASRYIKSSIFYHQDSWALLIAEGLGAWKKKFPDFPLRLEMNEDRGPNVRCILQVSAKSYDETARAFHEHIQDFLRRNPSPLAYPSEKPSFFMDFPVNHICYNLYQPIPCTIALPSASISLEKFFKKFSDEMIRQDYHALDEMLGNRFIFSLQLMTILSWCFSDNIVSEQACCSYYLSENLKVHTNTLLAIQEMEQQYAVYSEDLTALVANTRARLENANASWAFYSFISLFNNLVADIHALKSEEIKIHAIAHVFRKLNHTLCVKNDLLVAFFLERSLSALPEVHR